ncbi:protein MHF1 homolog [Selaginella moellendorffii]|uniref:protein MHF1 homolog n=1 Tax=Selaginella moellendorffii TaxID=88036 RepID=UPI000D1C9CDF|nr:protein MHF1 homolog [Selaginella moellendorffii]|eukprot:XP_024519367.1 protein MHF1 homolog [Selaginella moellendorffii]
MEEVEVEGEEEEEEVAVVEEEDRVKEERARVLRDRLRIAVIGVAESQARQSGLTVSQPVMTAICDITHKFTEQLGKELQLFAHHAGRKSINMDDVILAARRNEDVATALKAASHELPDKKRKKAQGEQQDNHFLVID